MSTRREADRAIDDIKDVIDNLISERDDLIENTYTLKRQLESLQEKIDDLKSDNADLLEQIDELKLEVLEAQKIINESQHQTLNAMYNSVDGGDKTLAQEVINNLYKK
jgi:predicted nuclease with TOPRIM domain